VKWETRRRRSTPETPALAYTQKNLSNITFWANVKNKKSIWRRWVKCIYLVGASNLMEIWKLLERRAENFEWQKTEQAQTCAAFLQLGKLIWAIFSRRA
jgi:hypothetical protein